jgi:hypothetical protein
VDVLGLAKVATDGRGILTALGQVILDVAKGDPNAARSLLMASQVGAEMSGANVAGQAQGEDAIRNVTRAIETAVGQAQSDGRNEWKLIAPQAGADSYFGGYKDAWMSAKLAEYAPMIAANAETAIELRAAERAANNKATAYQNSAPYKIREFLDAPMDVGAALFSGFMGTDVTTGTAVTWNSLNNGGGFGLTEVSPGERAFAGSLVMLGPISRGAGFVDDFVRVGARGRSFSGTALKPWGVNPAPGKYTVGIYDEIRGTVPGLDAHHVGQKAVMGKLVPGYDPATAPAILVPKIGHTRVGPTGRVSTSTGGFTNPRDVIARDIWEMRRVYPDVPNSRLQQLIEMNKEMYPSLNK